MKPEFRIDRRGRYWTVEIFYLDPDEGSLLYGFEEPYNEATYQQINKWCYDNFKTWLYPKRVRRMGFMQFDFASKRDLDWFILHWSGVDIPIF